MKTRILRAFELARKASKKSPRVVIQRLQLEVSQIIERYSGPFRDKNFNASRVLGGRCEEVWNKLSQFDLGIVVNGNSLSDFDSENMFANLNENNQLSDAMENVIDILGSNRIELGSDIDWSNDYKVGFRWENKYVKDYEYNNLDQPSDVKMAWELSRLQWLIPVGQAYILTGDEKYANKVKQILSHWIEHNPYAHSINWACTMEPAIRIFSFLWFFLVFSESKSWLSDKKFKELFLKSLYLHGDFVDRHFEMSDVNGNHCTADASALYIIGLFFQNHKFGKKWKERGKKILEHEIIRQVFEDGADFEGSVPYHRLVAELFFFPIVVGEKNGDKFSSQYCKRVASMAEFSQYYSRNDGSTPLLGDADDARMLPFGTQKIGDHRYLYEWIFYHLKPEACSNKIKELSEIKWLIGNEVNQLDIKTKQGLRSKAFTESGYYIFRNETDHLFIDASPIGLAGRGGHGHNDCLSFELSLDNQVLITDSGSFAYTGNYKQRNLFRSTAYHNSVLVDSLEINRFISDTNLWNMYYDAIPSAVSYQSDESRSELKASHSGYNRLQAPVDVSRVFSLSHKSHTFELLDNLESEYEHEYKIYLHFHHKVKVTKRNNKNISLESDGKFFSVIFDTENEIFSDIFDGWESESYGVKIRRASLVVKSVGKNLSLKTIVKREQPEDLLLSE